MTGSKDNGLTVKPAVYFNKLTKEFDFSAALPKGVKVNSIFLFVTKCPIFEYLLKVVYPIVFVLNIFPNSSQFKRVPSGVAV